MGKKLELFASTLNGIPISVRCVSSMIVCLNRLLAAHANKKDRGKRRSPTRVPCFASWNILTFNFYRSLDCARKNTSQWYTFQRSMKLIEIKLYGRENCPLQVVLQQSTQNTANFPLQTYEENRWTLLLLNTGVDFSLRNKFANSGSFAKISVSVLIYNSLTRPKNCIFKKYSSLLDQGITVFKNYNSLTRQTIKVHYYCKITTKIIMFHIKIFFNLLADVLVYLFLMKTFAHTYIHQLQKDRNSQ